MNKNLLLDFVVDKSNYAIQIKKEYTTETSLVWDAFTKSEILDKWWAPKPWKTKTKSMDFKEGGKWLYAMCGPEGEEHWSFAQYKTIEYQKRFIAVDGFCDSDGKVNLDLPQSTWNTVFHKTEKGTQVEIKIQFSGIEQIETIISMGFKEGISMTLVELESILNEK